MLTHAAINPSADGEAERARRNDAGFRRERTVGKEDARRVIGDSSAVQQFPRFSIGVDSPTADNARIEEIKAPFTWPIDLSVGVADQDGLALVDGDLRRTDLNHEWHGDALPLRGPVGARAERRRLVARMLKAPSLFLRPVRLLGRVGEPAPEAIGSWEA